MSGVYNEEVKGTGTGNFFKWEQVGQEFEGIFLRIQQNVNKRQPDRPLFAGIFRKLDSGAEIQVNAPTELLNKLQSVAPGTQLHIKYTGQAQSSRGGMPRKTFVVMKASAGAPAPASNGYATVPSAPPAEQPNPLAFLQPPSAAPVPTDSGLDGLYAKLEKHVGASGVELTRKALVPYDTAAQVRMLSETLVKTYGEKL